MVTLIKQNDADWFHCRFCALMFTTYDEYKSHTYRHFNTKTCPECYVLLIEICENEWFCLHTTSNCQHSHQFTAAVHSDSDGTLLPLAIKQELQLEIDSNLNSDFETDEKEAKIFQSQELVLTDNCGEMEDLDENLMKRKKKCNRAKQKNSQNPVVKETFPCVKCGRNYSSRSNLTKHFKRHEKDGNPRVAEERRLFGDVDEELVERQEIAETSTVKNVSSTEQKNGAPSDENVLCEKNRRPTTFTCNICDKTLATYSCIEKHMLSKHSGKTKRKGKLSKCDRTTVRHMCSVCGKQFPDRSNMRAHERIHFGIKTAACTLCGKKFSNGSGLRKHMKVVHEKERSFRCDIDGCEWKFGHSGALKRHKARLHGMVTNRNACPICTKEFPNSTYHLNRHLKAHANNTAKEYVPSTSKVVVVVAAEATSEAVK